MSLSTYQQTLLDELAVIEDPQERLGAVIDRARHRPPLPQTQRIEQNRVLGCQSQVWILRTHSPEFPQFLGDSDSPLVRGLVLLTCEFFSGPDPATLDALAAGIDPLQLLGLAHALSLTRRNGLAAARARLQCLARQPGQPPP